jgi:hypothetical protein
VPGVSFARALHSVATRAAAANARTPTIKAEACERQADDGRHGANADEHDEHTVDEGENADADQQDTQTGARRDWKKRSVSHL